MNYLSLLLNKNYTNYLYRNLAKWFSILAFIGILWLTLAMQASFKSSQKSFSRVKAAYSEKEKSLKTSFKEKGLDYSSFKMILVGFKYEQELQVFIADKNHDHYQWWKTYDFCVLSGELGPKRKEGDNQVPEGLYEISNFNPQSNYHLSLKVNYPNKSDQVLSDKKKPGGDIYIHGNCVSIGCIPVTDDLIKEIYVLAVETKNRGAKIPVYIFPFKMTEEKLEAVLKTEVGKTHKSFWKNLAPTFQEFIKVKKALTYKVNSKGEYEL